MNFSISKLSARHEAFHKKKMEWTNHLRAYLKLKNKVFALINKCEPLSYLAYGTRRVCHIDQVRLTILCDSFYYWALEENFYASARLDGQDSENIEA